MLATWEVFFIKVNAKCALLFSVSKPDAENPVVKRTKIPRPEKEEISRNYQRNSTAPKIEGKLSRYNGCFIEFRESLTIYGDQPWPLPCLDLSSTLSDWHQRQTKWDSQSDRESDRKSNRQRVRNSFAVTKGQLLSHSLQILAYSHHLSIDTIHCFTLYADADQH